MGQNKIGIAYGLAAALLFAVATPLAKALLASTPPLMLAALFYCGSGLGLSIYSLWRRFNQSSSAHVFAIEKSEIAWLAPAILCGGVLAPVAMMYGLSTSGAASGSMLLNLEGVFTAAIAWVIFKENVDRRVFIGMVAILLGGCLLSLNSSMDWHVSSGSLLIALACVLWAMDNNFCRNVSTSDSVLVAMTKGLVAGFVNLSVAFATGLALPPLAVALPALLIGFLSYGLSLVCYLTAQRYLGTARTGAYFASAPFVGALLSLIFLHESLTVSLAVAGVLMAIGLWLHLTEEHCHMHVHEEMEHSHEHLHNPDDPHHTHDHEPGVDTTKPHTHWHKHERLEHEHAHYPDMHHFHTH